MWDRFIGGKTCKRKRVRSWRKLAEDGTGETRMEDRGRKQGRLGRRSLRLWCNFKEVSAESSGCPQSKVAHRRTPSSPKMALAFSPCLLSHCLGPSHGKQGLGESVVRDFCHYSWGMHNAWAWRTTY